MCIRDRLWYERAKLLAFQTTSVQVLFMSGVPLFRIGQPYFTITFQLNNYLTVYCNKRIKTVKSIKTTKYQCEFELCQFFKFQSYSLNQTINFSEMNRFKIACGTYARCDKFLDWTLALVTEHAMTQISPFTWGTFSFVSFWAMSFSLQSRVVWWRILFKMNNNFFLIHLAKETSLKSFSILIPVSYTHLTLPTKLEV